MKELDRAIREYSKKVELWSGYVEKAKEALKIGKKNPLVCDVNDLRQELEDAQHTRQMYFQFLKDLEAIKDVSFPDDNLIEKFTVKEIKNYILSQESLGDVMYNLKAEKIIQANVPEDEDDY